MAVQTLVVIKQSVLQQILDLGTEIRDKQSRLDGLKGQIKDLLFAKAPIESGRLHARLLWRVTRNPAWRQIVVERLGLSYAEEVKRNTPIRRVCEIQVTEHGTLPLWKDVEEEVIE